MIAFRSSLVCARKAFQQTRGPGANRDAEGMAVSNSLRAVEAAPGPKANALDVGL